MSTNKVLVAFSGLAWNMKSTLADIIEKNYQCTRLIQTNKSALDKNPDLTPNELVDIFTETNKELVVNSNSNLFLTDRFLFDYSIYDVMMNPVYTWDLNSRILNFNIFDFNKSKIIDAMRLFDKVLVISLVNSNQNFINTQFELHGESSTGYLFDNPKKYFYYSRLFESLSDNLFNSLHYLVNFDRAHFKFTESDTPDEFQKRVLDYANDYLGKLL